MEYQIFISIVNISANFKNIGININIDKEILENIDIVIDYEVLENIDIDKEILENIAIDKILNRFEFGISNRANCTSYSFVTILILSIALPLIVMV